MSAHHPFPRRGPLAGMMLGLCLVLSPLGAAGQDSITLLQTDPVSPATLNNFENLNLRIGYTVSRPVQVRAEGFFQGAPVPGTSSGMGFYDTGSGEAFYWISYLQNVHVDRIDVTALDAASGRAVATASVPVDFSWTGVTTGTLRSPATWVARLQADRDKGLKAGEAWRIAHESLGMKLYSVLATLFAFVAFFCVPGYFVAQAVLLWRWRGGWRLWVAAPLAPMGMVIVYIGIACARGSNIAPVVLVFAAPVACFYFALLGAFRYLSSRAATPRAVLRG